MRRATDDPSIADMDAAFGFLAPAPASGARILAGRNRPGAGRTADRRIAARHQRVPGQVVRVDVIRQPRCVPTGKRVHLDPGAVGLEQVQRRALAALAALAAGDPAVEPVQRGLQRLGLAQGAAGVGFGQMQHAVRVMGEQGFSGRANDPHVLQIQRLGHVALIGHRFGEQHHRVHEQHRRIRVALRQHVQQHHRFRTEAGNHGDAPQSTRQGEIQGPLGVVGETGVQCPQIAPNVKTITRHRPAPECKARS